MAIKGLYRGFSSYEYQNTKSFGISDVELVKLDILNHIFTRKGERVMMPNFGTRIPDMAFEPLDAITTSIIEEDLRAVIAFDPRVQLLNLVLEQYPDEYAIVVRIRVLYVELNMEGSIDLNIDVGGTS